MGSIVKNNKGKFIVLLLLVALIFILCYLSISKGFIDTSYDMIIDSYRNFNNSQEHIIIRTSRVPRTLNAFLVGGALGVSGLLIQGLTRNKLASPSVLGINSGAVFALVIAITYISNISSFGLAWISFFGALLTAILVYVLSGGLHREIRSTDLTLGGAALAALLFSLTQGILYRNDVALEEVVYWMTGSVEGKKMEVIIQFAPIIIGVIIFTLFIGKKLNVFSLGEEMAKSLGMKTIYLKILIIAIVSVLSGVSVALAGPVAFIGLVTPHIVNKFFGTDYRWLIPFSVLIGSSILLLADIMSRFIIYPKEVPVGALTALIGGPFFIYIAIRRENND
ncbi:FecCD family ABC transporter permease [Clostridium septicum]|uniref:Iron ABC transporter permease n=1 Tax=Clostridium septicum TaxID=1504 RepID=A0ABY5B2U4_CLOSE|nr:iron ABC transporter permease [Clostridium septicum]MDU1314315.1 iron ABC transporter permease [Clostridium septicum]QAS59760.1 iron ABC transporter permease [Clostridium septicum]UEC21004.1 iron ABC transporter permease [Clostridium septicum]USS00947.1 iron ABC transporter permease [Clostridium septicum]WLF69500.1 iron ABC transporter permease [Clostridium septicum]